MAIGGRALACSSQSWSTTGVHFLSQTQLPTYRPRIGSMSTHSWAHSKSNGQTAGVPIQQIKPLQPQSRVSAQRGQETWRPQEWGLLVPLETGRHRTGTPVPEAEGRPPMQQTGTKALKHGTDKLPLEKAKPASL